MPVKFWVPNTGFQYGIYSGSTPVKTSTRHPHARQELGKKELKTQKYRYFITTQKKKASRQNQKGQDKNRCPFSLSN